MTQPVALSADLEKLIRKHGYNPKCTPFTPDHSLLEDLQMSPEALEDFFVEYFERFAVDPGDFAFNRYFPFQGIRIPFLTKWQFKSWGIVDYRVGEPLTLGMVQHAIDMGRWDTDELRRVGEQGKGS
ncbi:DUF1493 family protein [Caballeronia sp. LZ065]|uniref:DUF1493 family protein n=1 Tax=Caballeronia sp. LZ065 TaxID=3038571 RepID=UPI00285A6D03|nr:DUF1493 family protein [Caballeronia sp. LZ065]MDR5783544.1 DUF1493 family protein [Caballeronia sp. LZ065]